MVISINILILLGIIILLFIPATKTIQMKNYSLMLSFIAFFKLFKLCWLLIVNVVNIFILITIFAAVNIDDFSLLSFSFFAAVNIEDLSLLSFPFFTAKFSFCKNKYYVFILQSTLVFALLLAVLVYFVELLGVSVLLALLYLYLTLLLYVLLYSWRKLEVSIGSLITFYCNLFILNLFLLGLNTLSKGLPNPIYVENLSEYSIYRYALYFFGILFAILGFLILKKYFPEHINKIDYITFPYLKEEVRVLLYTWNESFFGPIFTSFIGFLYESALVRYIYFTVHFVLFYFIRILQTILFCNFVFLGGDLRWNIYLLPLSFLSWVLRFFEYYFNTFFKGGVEYIRSCLVVTLKDPLTPLKNPKAYFLNGNDLNFEITSFAIAEGFQNDYDGTLVFLETEWLRFMHLLYFFSLYESRLAYLSKFIFFFRLLSWFAINM